MSEAEGIVRVNVDMRVPLAEFEGWPPDRIAAFFDGLSQVIASQREANPSEARRRERGEE